MSARKLALIVIVSVSLLSLSQFIFIQRRSSSSKAFLVRIHTIAILQILMSVLSYNAWVTLRPLPGGVISSPPPLPISSSVKLKATKNNVPLKRQKTSEIDLPSQTHSRIDTDDQRRWTLWESGVALYLILCHGSYATNFLFTGSEPHWLSVLCYACLGSLLQLSFAVACIYIFSFIISVCCRLCLGKYNRKPTPSDVAKSQRTTAILALIYVGIVSVLGLIKAAQPPAVKRVEIPIKDLPNNLKGLHIVQLSDIHLGPTVGYSKLKEIVNIVAKEIPDILVITGDLVDGTVKDLKDATAPLKSINPKYGKFYVTGNHEYFLGYVDDWFAVLRSLNFTILHNSNVKVPKTIPDGHGQICLAGTDDLQADKIKYGMGHSFDVKKAVEGCDDSKPVVLLAHQPVAAQMALDSGVRLDLILSGHTHGGQMFPGEIIVDLINPFSAGLYKVHDRDTHVYVSAGTMYWGIPMRIGSTMEITSIKLS